MLPTSFGLKPYLHLLGFDRRCGRTGTVFGPGFLPTRSVRVTFLQAIGIFLLTSAD